MWRNMRLLRDPIKRQRTIIAITFIVSLVALGIFANPQTSTYVTTAGGGGIYPFSIEGDLNPTDQSIYIGDVATDDVGVYNISVNVNGIIYGYNGTLKNSGIEWSTYSLTSGKNFMEVTPSDSPVVAIVTYTPQWKPRIIKYNMIGLAKDVPTKISITSSDRNKGQPILKSYVMIKALEDDEIVYDESFDGTSTIITIDDIGDYIAYMSVFDGVGWSDTYFVKFGVYLTKQEQQYDIPKRTDFIVNVEQPSGQKSLIRKLLISDLMVGEDAKFLILIPPNKRIIKSHVLIKRTDAADVIFDEVLKGSKATVHIGDIGNYIIFMEVFDGAVWSDTYYSEFTAFAYIERDIEKWPTRIPSSNVLEGQTVFPLIIDGEDTHISSLSKKIVNGYYSIYRHIVIHGYRGDIN